MRTLFCALFLLPGVYPADSVAMPRHTLTNEGLLVLASAGLTDTLLADLVRLQRTSFDTSAAALALLARQGLSETVIRSVVEKQDQVTLRPPQAVLTPIAETTVPNGGLLLIPPAKPSKKEPGRWYKLTIQP